jgi:transcriptional regulator with XRE-family HTH domain
MDDLLNTGTLAEVRSGSTEHWSTLSPAAPCSDLASARRGVGLSQDGLARRIGVNHATVSRWESRERRPAFDLVPLIADVLGVDVEEVESWFSGMPTLGGDTLGRMPGLKRLLRDAGISLSEAAWACNVSVGQMTDWVIDRHSLPRFMLPRLCVLFGMPKEQFLPAARQSVVDLEGSFLRERRKQCGMTQSALARKIAKSTVTVSKWERGEATPLEIHVHRLAGALSLDCSELVAAMGWPYAPANQEDSADLPLHRRLRRARLEAGLNAAQLGRCVGVTGQTVRKWESGEFRPKKRTRARLMLVLPALGPL